MADNATPAVEVTGPASSTEVAIPVVLIEAGEGVLAQQNAIPVYFVEPGPGVRIANQNPTPMQMFTAGTVVTSARNAIPVWATNAPPPEPPFPGAAEVLDFVEGYYRVENGTEYTTAADAGWTGTGTFDANGYTATGTQVISKALSISGDFVIYAQFVEPATPATRRLITDDNTTNISYSSGGEITTVPTAGSNSSTATRIAFGRSGGSVKKSFDNGAVATGGAYTAPGSRTFYIGNGGAPFIEPWTAAIARIVIYKATLSDAEIQALGT